jgi:hypothetical protein
LQAIQQGKPIEPPPDPVTGQREWTGNNMLSLAGLLFAAASRKEPCEFRSEDVSVDDQPVVTDQDRERVRTLHEAELHSALDFLRCVAVAVWDGQYPPSWDATMTGWIDEEYDQVYLPILRPFDDEEPKPAC